MHRLTLASLLLCATAAAALAASPYDGVYKGSNANAGGPGARCPAGQSFNVVVRDGAFNWRVGSDSVPVTVGADGSFTGQSGRRYINGKITGNTLTAQTTGEACNFSWSHTK